MKEYFRRQRIYYRYHRRAVIWPVIMVILVIVSGYLQAFAVLLCSSITLGLTSVCVEAENALPRTQAEVRRERLGRLWAIFLEQLVLGVIAYALHYVYVWAAMTQRVGYSSFMSQYLVNHSVLRARPWFMAMFFALEMLAVCDWLLDADSVHPLKKTTIIYEDGQFRMMVRPLTLRGITDGVCAHFPTIVILFYSGILLYGRSVLLAKSPLVSAILVGAAIVCKVIRIAMQRAAYQPADFETMKVGAPRKSEG